MRSVFAVHEDGQVGEYGRKSEYIRLWRDHYDGLVHKMLECGNPEQMGDLEKLVN